MTRRTHHRLWGPGVLTILALEGLGLVGTFRADRDGVQRVVDPVNDQDLHHTVTRDWRPKS
jgi:hypothetical protein